MKRIALLTLVIGLLSVPVAAELAVTDGVPLMKGPLTVLPGTLVPITPPARPRPCAPLAKGDIPVMTGNLTTLPGTIVTVDPPSLPEPRKR